MRLDKLFHFLICFTLVGIFLLSFPVIALADSTTVVLSFLSPGASPQDLAWDGNYLWCVDDSTDSLYKLNPSDGAIISAFPTPGLEPRGLTWDGSYLWCSDGDSVKIFKIDPTDGTVLSSIPAPISTAANAPPASEQVRGLAWDGQYLWSACFSVASRVFKVNPGDGSILDFSYTLFPPEGLTSDGTYLWVAKIFTPEHPTRKVYRYRIIDDGAYAVSYFETPGYSSTGLAYESSEYLWLADTGTDTIYKLENFLTRVESRDDQLAPTSFKLLQNYPNPFNSETVIGYELPFLNKVTLEIFDIRGRVVERLVNNLQDAGTHEVIWDGKNEFNQRVPSGTYFYRLRTGRLFKIRKMTLIR